MAVRTCEATADYWGLSSSLMDDRGRIMSPEHRGRSALSGIPSEGIMEARHVPGPFSIVQALTWVRQVTEFPSPQLDGVSKSQ